MLLFRLDSIVMWPIALPNMQEISGYITLRWKPLQWPVRINASYAR